MSGARTRITLLTITFCGVLVPSPARTQESPIEIGVEVSPSAYARAVPIPIALSFCNTTAEPVMTYDACGGSCFFDLLIENEAGDAVAWKGLVGPAVIVPLTWDPYECWRFDLPWNQKEGYLFSDGGPQAPSGTYRAHLLFYALPPVQETWSEPFLIGAPVTVVPTLSRAGLAALVLTLVGAALAVLRVRR